MSETQRRKKDGEDKNKKNQRIEKKPADEKQNGDRKSVEESRGPDQYDKLLKNAS